MKNIKIKNKLTLSLLCTGVALVSVSSVPVATYLYHLNASANDVDNFDTIAFLRPNFAYDDRPIAIAGNYNNVTIYGLDNDQYQSAWSDGAVSSASAYDFTIAPYNTTTGQFVPNPTNFYLRSDWFRYTVGSSSYSINYYGAAASSQPYDAIVNSTSNSVSFLFNRTKSSGLSSYGFFNYSYPTTVTVTIPFLFNNLDHHFTVNIVTNYKQKANMWTTAHPITNFRYSSTNPNILTGYSLPDASDEYYNLLLDTYSKELVIPTSTTRIDSNAFSNNNSNVFPMLSKLSEDSNKAQYVIGTSAFLGRSLITDLDIPNCTAIENSAFDLSNVTTTGGIEHINISGVTSIGQNAFRSQTKLSDFVANSLTTIGDGAFSKCLSLNSISIPNVSSIPTSAFSGTNLCSLKLGAPNNTPVSFNNPPYSQNFLLNTPFSSPSTTNLAISIPSNNASTDPNSAAWDYSYYNPKFGWNQLLPNGYPLTSFFRTY